MGSTQKWTNEEWEKRTNPTRIRADEVTNPLTAAFAGNKISFGSLNTDLNIVNHDAALTIEGSFDGATVNFKVRAGGNFVEEDVAETDVWLRSSGAPAYDLTAKT